jgi:predicted ATPase
MLYGPELLRVKGRLLLANLQHRPDEAERCFLRALELAHRQGALAWELRTATDLAELWSSSGRVKDARDILKLAVEKFTEGWETQDMRAAKSFLETLSRL